jgi:hypothetical protein
MSGQLLISAGGALQCTAGPEYLHNFCGLRCGVLSSAITQRLAHHDDDDDDDDDDEMMMMMMMMIR